MLTEVNPELRYYIRLYMFIYFWVLKDANTLYLNYVSFCVCFTIANIANHDERPHLVHLV